MNTIKPFEFVLIMVSVVVGLVLTEFAICISYMLQYFRTASFYGPHMAFLAFGFIGCLNYWATLYSLRKEELWTVSKMGIVISTSLLFSVASQIVRPDEENFNHDYRQYFIENSAVLYGVVAVLVISLVAETYFIKKNRTLRWYLIMSCNIILAASAIVMENEMYRGILAFVLLAGQIYNMYSNPVIIQEQN